MYYEYIAINFYKVSINNRSFFFSLLLSFKKKNHLNNVLTTFVQQLPLKRSNAFFEMHNTDQIKKTTISITITTP